MGDSFLFLVPSSLNRSIKAYPAMHCLDFHYVNYKKKTGRQEEHVNLDARQRLNKQKSKGTLPLKERKSSICSGLYTNQGFCQLVSMTIQCSSYYIW